MLLATLGLAGCGPNIQTTSGSDYLSRYQGAVPRQSADAAASGRPMSVDEEVAQVAAVEPTLRFPARIGLARIAQGHLTAVPADEVAIWTDLAGKLGPEYGTVVPVDPLAAEFTVQSLPPRSGLPDRSGPAEVVREVRLGAARQHVDAVLVYETALEGETGDTPLQLLNLTVVGYFLMPSTEVHADAVTSALFLDVRNGYPYATLQGKARRNGFTASNTARDSLQGRSDEARAASVQDLADQMPQALARLAIALNTRSTPGLSPAAGYAPPKS